MVMRPGRPREYGASVAGSGDAHGVSHHGRHGRTTGHRRDRHATGNTISLVQLGAIARTAPAAVRSGQIGTAASWNRVDLQWQPVAAAAVGPDIAGYWVYRDGAYLGRVSGTVFTDETVAARQELHLFDLRSGPARKHVARCLRDGRRAALARDRAEPAAHRTRRIRRGGAPPLPRSSRRCRRHQRLRTAPVGVRPTGTYWGGAGEQIDVLFGNLNFTVPLLNPKSRGGWGVTFALTYNSQIWRQDSGGAWLFGHDVGYGLGMETARRRDHADLVRIADRSLPVHRLQRRRIPARPKQQRRLDLAGGDLRQLRFQRQSAVLPGRQLLGDGLRFRRQ